MSDFQPTMHLRFVKRMSKDYPGETGYRYVLQQKWKARDGRYKWKNVQRFDPFNGEGHDDAGIESKSESS